MIIKQTKKFEMPNLKRRKKGDVDCEDDDACSVNPKKQKTIGYNSIPLSGFNRSHGDSVEDNTSIVDSCCTGAADYAVEVQLNSNNHRGLRDMNQNSEWYRPPLFKSSRGRIRALPSRFNDSVIDSRKDSSKLDYETVMSNKGRIKHSGLHCGGQIYKKQHKENKFSFQKQKYNKVSVKLKEGEMGCTEFNALNTKMYWSSHSSVTSIHEGNCSPLVGSDEFPPRMFNDFTGKKKLAKKAGNRKDFYRPEDFVLGDIVWAKSGKKYPARPGIVIDPLWQTPETVLRACVPGNICVMFFAYSRDYAWVKQGMIFPFLEYMDRFQGQTQLYGSKPSDFQMAIEEAFLAEHGYIDTGLGSGHETFPVASHSEIQEVTGSNQDQECYSHNQDAFDKKDTRPCGSCGFLLPCKRTKRTKDSASEAQFFCEHCAKLLKSKQCCGICKKIWHHSDGGNWVCCDGPMGAMFGCMLSVPAFLTNVSRLWRSLIITALNASQSLIMSCQL